MENNDEKIILQLRGRSGWYSYLLDYVMPACYWAKKKDKSPIIDMHNDESMVYKDEENVWERFYKQPAGITLAEAQKQGIDRKICPANRKMNPWNLDSICLDGGVLIGGHSATFGTNLLF